VTPVRFHAYRGQGRQITVIAERVTHWERIRNGDGAPGTTLHIDTGHKVDVDGLPNDVEKLLMDAYHAARSPT
jgi:hypothetical protein